jgi:hypothetical protein
VSHLNRKSAIGGHQSRKSKTIREIVACFA